MKVLSFFLYCCMLTWSCKQTTATGDASTESVSSDAKTLEAQVMAIHDEMMPKMNDIGHLSAQLRNIRAGLVETPEGKIEAPDGLDKVLESLKLADQGMWDWMKAYNDSKALTADDQMIPFFQKELVSINQVKKEMQNSIEKAQAWITAHPSNK